MAKQSLTATFVAKVGKPGRYHDGKGTGLFLEVYPTGAKCWQQRLRFRARAGAAPFVIGALVIEYDRRRVTVSGREVALTATEYEVLRILSVHAGRVVTSESLLRQAWEGREPTDTERVRSFVS